MNSVLKTQNPLTPKQICDKIWSTFAGMAELADAPDLGSGVSDVQVQVLLPAPNLRLAFRDRRFFFLYRFRARVYRGYLFYKRFP